MTSHLDTTLIQSARMARGKRQTKIIQVQSAPTDNCGVINLVKRSHKTVENTCKPDMTSSIVKMESECLDSSSTSTLATKDTTQEYVVAMQQISPSPENMSRGIEDHEDGFIEVQLKLEGPADNTAAVLEPDIMIVGNKVSEIKDENGKEKKKKKKKKSKKKNKKSSPDTEVIEDNKEEIKRPVKLAPIEKKEALPADGSSKMEARVLKNAGCFGFISTWLVKRKERRREKKRKTIEARKAKSEDSLVVYDSWVAKGGVAFTVEMDSRPMKMSVLPPIRQRPGPIRMATEQKLESAENKRIKHINKKIVSARAQSRLVEVAASRRARDEMEFKRTTLEKIREKEDKAFRATSRLQYAREQRCRSRIASRMESTPDIFTSKLESIVSAQSTPRSDSVTPLPPTWTESDIDLDAV